MRSFLTTRSLTVAALLAGAALTAAPKAQAQSIVQGPLWNSANASVYFRLSNSNWTDAENFAISQLAAHLVTINDAAENTFVLNNFANAPGSGRVWLGLNDAAVEGTYVWSSGIASAFRNWDAGEPNNGGGVEDWVIMYSGNGRWNDTQNLANPPGIGNVYGVVEVPCNISQLQTAINFQNGSTYTLLSPSSWSCAEQYAVNVMGAHLTTIRNASENEFVRSNFAALGTVNRVWMGLNDAATEGTFVWADGSTAAYRNWDLGEPSNGGGSNEDYVHMYNNGRWNDVKDMQNPPGVGNISGVVESPCATVTISAGPVVNPANGHTYYRTSLTRVSCAEAFAQTLGGHLASINDAAENAFVISTFYPVPTGDPIGIGLNDYTTEGTFVNFNGDPVTYTNWIAGEPNNSNGGEDFTMVNNLGGWNDIPNVPVYGIVEVPSIVNNACANAIVIPPEGATVNGTTTGASTDGSAVCGSSNFSGDVWFSYTPVCSGHVRISTQGGITNYDTVLSVHTGCPGTSANQITCNDDANPPARYSTVTPVLNGGQTYLIRVAGFGAAAGQFSLSVDPNSNDSCANKIDLGSGNATIPFTNSAATTDGPAEPSCGFCCGDDQINSDLWYLWRPTGNQRVVMTTCTGAFTFDTKLGVYAGNVCPNLPGSIEVCNDDAAGQCQTSGVASRVNFVAAAGSVHTLRVGGYLGNRGCGVLTITTYCIADVDDGTGTGTPDGGVTIDDLLYYLQIFEAGSLAADVDDGSGSGTPDGGVTIDDLLFFLARFESGC